MQMRHLPQLKMNSFAFIPKQKYEHWFKIQVEILGVKGFFNLKNNKIR